MCRPGWVDGWPIPCPYSILNSPANRPPAPNAQSDWVFPGYMPGSHLHASHVRLRLSALGFRPLSTRIGTWQTMARVMLRGPTDSASSVAVFDGSILATAAVSAPEAMIKTVGAALVGFGDLPDAEREMLFETFRVWRDNDASVCAAAEVLICHPNTVRHRLRRIEKHTGRSLSRPRDVAELCLAFEVHRRLM